MPISRNIKRLDTLDSSMRLKSLSLSKGNLSHDSHPCPKLKICKLDKIIFISLSSFNLSFSHCHCFLPNNVLSGSKSLTYLSFPSLLNSSVNFHSDLKVGYLEILNEPLDHFFRSFYRNRDHLSVCVDLEMEFSKSLKKVLLLCLCNDNQNHHHLIQNHDHPK